jgi:hypothetical protein
MPSEISMTVTADRNSLLECASIQVMSAGCLTAFVGAAAEITSVSTK